MSRLSAFLLLTLASTEATVRGVRNPKRWEKKEKNQDTGPVLNPELTGLTLGNVWDFTSSNGDGTSPSGACETREYADVVIIGAGMAGIKAAATIQATDPALTFVIVESQDRVGGRVRSHSFGSAPTITVEDGANWIPNMQGNPLVDMNTAEGINMPPQDFYDIKTYAVDGTPIDAAVRDQEQARFKQAWDSAVAEADNQWTREHDLWPDNGVKQLVESNGWAMRDGTDGDLDYAVQWLNIDYEYAAEDTSVRYFPYYEFDVFCIADERGFEHIPQTYFEQNVDTSTLRTSSRVNTINYNENVAYEGTNYKVLVSANNTATGACTDYYGQRVISTVSAGVLNSGDIAFNPPLVRSAEEYSPFVMSQFVKIFYQFKTQFWTDENEFFDILRDEEHRGQCHHWANLNLDGFYPGSNVLRCEIMTEAFTQRLDDNQELSQETLLSFLDPLRVVYGEEAVGTPLDMYYPKLNKDADFGYGAYANWKIGSTFTDFATFYGGQDDMVPYCQHNGCNFIGEWTMILSGSVACFEFAETVHGAYFAGEKAANQAMTELGVQVDAGQSPCDVNWQWLMRM